MVVSSGSCCIGLSDDIGPGEKDGGETLARVSSVIRGSIVFGTSGIIMLVVQWICRVSETLCCEGMYILYILSEEVYPIRYPSIARGISFVPGCIFSSGK